MSELVVNKEASSTLSGETIFRLGKFITICGMKLQLPSVTLTTSLHLFHRFNQEVGWNPAEIDGYLICAACIYLACQIEEESQVKLRDIINVFYRSLHPDRPALEINDTYWALRDSTLHVQMLLLRGLRFYVVHDAPHKYAVHYLKTLRDWLHPSSQFATLAQVAWNNLRDFYLSPQVLKFRPHELAVVAIERALLDLRIDLPLEDRLEGGRWWCSLAKSLNQQRIHEISLEMDRLQALDRRVS